MADDGENASRSEKDEIRRHAKRWVRHVRRDVLTTPARRAAVRAALGGEPGEARTFVALGEVSAFLPESSNPAVERAFLTVAAMMCAQPLRPREQDIAAGQANSTPAATKDPARAEQTDLVSGDSDSASTMSSPRSLGASCAEAVLKRLSRSGTMEARLHALCRANNVGVHRQLPRLVALLRSGLVEVDWAQLIEDLARWDRYSQRHISATWLRDYYRQLNDEPNDTTGKEKNEHAEVH